MLYYHVHSLEKGYTLLQIQTQPIVSDHIQVQEKWICTWGTPSRIILLNDSLQLSKKAYEILNDSLTCVPFY